MTCVRRQRGSVLMLAVALLTIIAMLGSTLLVVSYLSGQQLETQVARATPEASSSGLLMLVRNILKDDLYVSAGMLDSTSVGPYGAYPEALGPMNWLCYIDMPAGLPFGIPDMEIDFSNTYGDYWLSDHARHAGYREPDRWNVSGSADLTSSFDLTDEQMRDVQPYYSQLLGFFGAVEGEAVPEGAEKEAEKDGARRIMADTDGDTIEPMATKLMTRAQRDAFLAGGVSFDHRGRQGKVGVRVLDLSGLAPLNVGGNRYDAKDITPIGPASFELKRFVTGQAGDASKNYNFIHSLRSGGEPVPLKDYYEFCGRRLTNAMSSAGTSFSPFSFSEEAILRWHRVGTESARGRAAEALRGLDGVTRKHMTAYSVSSSIPRYPDRPGGTVDWLTRTMLELTGGGNVSIDDWMSRDKLYRKFLDIIGPRLSQVNEDDDGGGGGGGGASVILDDSSASLGLILMGNFYPGMGWTPYDYDAAYNLALNHSAIAGASAIWAPVMEGSCKLSLWWPIPDAGHPNPLGSITVTVSDANGTSEFTAGQGGGLGDSPGTDVWYEIPETFDFTGGGQVTVTCNGGVTIYADAIKLTPVQAVTTAEPAEAAHFIANLWAHLSDDDPMDRAFIFMPKDVDWWVFGAVEQLVITDVVAYYKPDDSVTGDDEDSTEQWFYAIELVNTMDEPVSVTSEPVGGNIESAYRYYQLMCGSNTWSFTKAGGPSGLPTRGNGALYVKAGQRVVLYDIFNGAWYNTVDGGDQKLTAAEVLPGSQQAQGPSSTRLFFDIDPVEGSRDLMAAFPEEGIRIVRHFEALTPADVVDLKESINPDKTLPYPHIYIDVPVDSIHPAELPSGDENGMMVSVIRDDDGCRPDEETKPIRDGRYRSLIPYYKSLAMSDPKTWTAAAPPEDAHKLGAVNGMSAEDFDGEGELNIFEGFWIRRLKLDPDVDEKVHSFADLGDVYLVGPDSQGKDMPHQLLRHVRTDTGEFDLTGTGQPEIEPLDTYHNKTSRGRARLGKVNPRLTKYPNVPWATLIQEVFEIVPPDENAPVTVLSAGEARQLATRIYGRVNINTAPPKVLAAMPWPWQQLDRQSREIVLYRKDGQELYRWELPVPGDGDWDWTDLSAEEFEAEMSDRVARYIADYRRPPKAVNIMATPASYITVGGTSIMEQRDEMWQLEVDRGDWEDLDNQINGTLRVPLVAMDDDPLPYFCSSVDGYLTPGEIAIPLARFVERELMGLETEEDRKAAQRKAYFLEARAFLYRAVANLVTVNSDSYAVLMYVDLGTPRNYLAIIDRSNCRADPNRTAEGYQPVMAPSVLMMVELK